jgi:hypothetical protein
VKTMTCLSREQAEQITSAQKKHAVIDPCCETLTADEVVNWHPVGGISWEERAKRMKAEGITPAETMPSGMDE